MQTLFADTFYWVALINAKDQWHRQVRSFSTLIKDYPLITTDLVLIGLQIPNLQFPPHTPVPPFLRGVRGDQTL